MQNVSYDSSTEECRMRQAPVRRKRKRDAIEVACESASAVAPIAFNAEMVRRAIAVEPHIELLPALLRDHPHTGMDSACAFALSKFATHGVPDKSLRSMQPTPGRESEWDLATMDPARREQLHYENSQRMPLALERLLELHSKLSSATFRVESETAIPTHADACRNLRMRARHLPMYTAQHESFLLRQSGTLVTALGTIRVLPPCMLGRACIGFVDARVRRIQGLTEPIILMRAMSPEQWKALINNSEAPAGRSPCVLCHRLSIQEYVHWRRFVLASGTNNTLTCSGWEVKFEDEHEVAQLWRNRVDESDGYFREYVTMPNDGELVVDPLACSAFHGLKATKDATTHMWTIDQSPMIWVPPEGDRSKEAEGQKAASASAWRAARIMDAIRTGKVDWAACVNSFTLPVSLTQAACDASFFSDIASVRSPMSTLISKVLNSRCQARKYGTVAEKTLIETDAQKRRYDATLAKWRANLSADPPDRHHEQRDDKFVLDYVCILTRRRNFRKLLLCSMLGNYQHCKTRISCARTRAILYGSIEVGVEDARGVAWFQSLLHGCPSLVVWCVRDFLVHCILDDEALHNQVRDLIHFDLFRRLVDLAMAKAREYIQNNARHAWSSMGKSLHFASATICSCLTLPMHCIHTGQWLSDVSQLLMPYHEQMLGIQYHKPKIDAVAWLVSSDARKVASLVPRRASPQEESQEKVELDCFEEDDLFDGPMRHSVSSMLTRYKGAKEHADEIQRATQSDVEVTTNVFTYLTPVQFASLSALVSDRQRRIKDGCLESVVLRMESFGVDAQTTAYTLKMLDCHRTSSLPKQGRMAMLLHLRERHPHAYNLLQIAAELIKENGMSSGRIVGYFSVQTIEAQIEAANKKLLDMLTHMPHMRLSHVRKSMADDAPLLAQVEAECFEDIRRIKESFDGALVKRVEQSGVSLYFCSVCQTVYSNVRDATNPTIRKFYRHGLRNALTEYATGEAYCKQSLVNHRGSCRDSKLTRIDMVGIRYALGKKTYQLCVGCSDLMVPDSQSGGTCTFNDDGMLCSFCTQRLVASKRPKLAVDRVCVCCGTLTTTNQSTYLYPHGLCLCRHDHSTYMSSIVQQHVLATKDDARKLLTQLWVAHKEFRRKRAQPESDRRMKRNKQANRSKKA